MERINSRPRGLEVNFIPFLRLENQTECRLLHSVMDVYSTEWDYSLGEAFQRTLSTTDSRIFARLQPYARTAQDVARYKMYDPQAVNPDGSRKPNSLDKFVGITLDRRQTGELFQLISFVAIQGETQARTEKEALVNKRLKQARFMTERLLNVLTDEDREALIKDSNNRALYERYMQNRETHQRAAKIYEHTFINDLNAEMAEAGRTRGWLASERPQIPW